MLCVLLDTGVDGRRVAWLRGLTGADERAAEAGATALLDRLLVPDGRQAVPPGMAARLPVSDRDRLLAALLRDLSGDRVEADAPCLGCGESFAVQFSLSALTDARRGHRPSGVKGPDERSCYRLDGVTFRLPGAADLDAVLALPADARRTALLSACVVAGTVEGREEIVEAAMAALGPTLDLALEAVCPHCEAPQAPHFSVTGYLLDSLANERRFLLREVHRIARAYGWPYASIMALPRRDRQDLVRLIDGDGGQVRPAARTGMPSAVRRAEAVR